MAVLDIFGIDYVNSVIEAEGKIMNDYLHPHGAGRRRKYFRAVSLCRDGTTSKSRELGYIVNECINYPKFYLQHKEV